MLVAKCDNIKQYLTEDVFVGLGLCSALLPDEEGTIGQQDFEALVGIISDLELLLLDEKLPTSLTALIRRHIRAAELAIAQYPIRGAIALKDAARFTAGNVAIDQELIKQAMPKEAVEKLVKTFHWLNSAADAVIKVDSLIQIGGRAVKLLDDFSDP